MRENRTYSSEGGDGASRFLPLSGNPVGLAYHRKMDASPGFPLSRE